LPIAAFFLVPHPNPFHDSLRSSQDLRYCSKKLIAAKLWENDETGKPWRVNVNNLPGEILLVSQFTLYGSVANKKHTPDFKTSMKSAEASVMYENFKAMVREGMGAEERVKVSFEERKQKGNHNSLQRIDISSFALLSTSLSTSLADSLRSL